MPPIPRAHSPSEGSTALVKEDEGESSDEADKTSSQNTTQGEKVGDAEGCRGGGTGSFLPTVPVPSGRADLGIWVSVLSPPCLSTPVLGWGGHISHSAGEATLQAIAAPLLLQRSGFGWFSWFRSKPPDKAPPSGDEDSPDSPDSEVT